MADRYCRNCGHELAEDDRFCPSCGKPAHEPAHLPTPEADRPVSRIPPAAERNAWQRIRYGTLDSPPPPPSSPQEVRARGVGVWTGVKLGCGMFIVLPIIIIVVMILFWSIVSSGI
jgi:hypothetical protein